MVGALYLLDTIPPSFFYFLSFPSTLFLSLSLSLPLSFTLHFSPLSPFHSSFLSLLPPSVILSFPLLSMSLFIFLSLSFCNFDFLLYFALFLIPFSFLVSYRPAVYSYTIYIYIIILTILIFHFLMCHFLFTLLIALSDLFTYPSCPPPTPSL